MFFQRSKATVQAFLDSVPIWQGLKFLPSRKEGIHLSAYIGEGIEAIPDEHREIHAAFPDLVQREGDYINLVFPQALLWLWLGELMETENLPAGWAEGSETPDFSPIPYARNRLRMELYLLQYTMNEKKYEDGSETVEGLLWPLFALGFWSKGQRRRVLTKGAAQLAEHLEARWFHDEKLKTLWTAWALLLSEEHLEE